VTAYSYGPYGLGFYGDVFASFVDEVAFASLPFGDPQVYTDLTARTRLRSWRRGRQSETVQTDTGTSSTTFENMDRALDSENKASVYYPNVLPMRRIRCTVTLGGTTYYLFTHFIDPLQGWQLIQDSPGYAEAVVACERRLRRSLVRAVHRSRQLPAGDSRGAHQRDPRPFRLARR